jgi:hypothetical protein
MDLDEEILRRITNTEDHFTERKTSPHRDQITEAIVAFANSVLATKPGIIYVGVTDEGKIVGCDNPESWQQKITGWANGCFPEVTVIPRVLQKDEKQFLAVVVPLSAIRPHFARPAFKRNGAKTVPASQGEIDEWIAYRNSKVRFILERKNEVVSVQMLTRNGVPLSAMQESGGLYGIPGSGEYTVIDCNPHFVTLRKLATMKTITHPLAPIDLKMNDAKLDQLLLLIRSARPDEN